jgi:hypothetical protein
MSYTKLFSSILDSTVWQLPLATKVVWITMLAMRDRDGVVEASVPGLAIRAGVDRSECERALAILMAPDPDSRTTEAEGRRIEKVPGGWRLINHDLYAAKLSDEDRKEKDAARQRRRRAKLADLSRSVTGAVTSHEASEEIQPVAHVTTSEQQVEQQGQGEQSPSRPVSIDGPAAKATRALAEQVRQAVQEHWAREGFGPPREVSDFDWKGWRDVAVWLEATGKAQGWDESEPAWRTDRPRWIVRRFYKSSDKRTKGANHKISYLAADPSQYAFDEAA